MYVQHWDRSSSRWNSRWPPPLQRSRWSGWPGDPLSCHLFHMLPATVLCVCQLHTPTHRHRHRHTGRHPPTHRHTQTHTESRTHTQTQRHRHTDTHTHPHTHAHMHICTNDSTGLAGFARSLARVGRDVPGSDSIRRKWSGVSLKIIHSPVSPASCCCGDVFLCGKRCVHHAGVC